MNINKSQCLTVDSSQPLTLHILYSLGMLLLIAENGMYVFLSGRVGCFVSSQLGLNVRRMSVVFPTNLTFR